MPSKPNKRGRDREFFIRYIPYLFLFCLVCWAFILFLYLLGIPLSLHLVYIAEFRVAFLYSGSLWSSLYCRVSSLWVGLDRWLVKVLCQACAGVLVGAAGFLLSGVQ